MGQVNSNAVAVDSQAYSDNLNAILEGKQDRFRKAVSQLQLAVAAATSRKGALSGCPAWSPKHAAVGSQVKREGV